MNKKTYNKGFSLVELIIVIAIMAILSAAIAPALIRYINKARKADDIAAADTIAVSVNAAVSSNEEMYEFLDYNIKETKGGNSENYRILGFSSVATSAQGRGFNTQFRTNANLPSSITSQAQTFADFMNDDLGNDLVKMRFTSFSKLDQWILCVDKNGQLSVWVGADMNGNQWFIDKNTHKVNNNSQRYYMLWPEVDSAYKMLGRPDDAEG